MTGIRGIARRNLARGAARSVQDARGITLIEMLVSIILAALVLMGVLSITASVMRSHFETAKRGEVSGVTLYALDDMQRQLSRATYLLPGRPSTSGGNEAAFCMNWSSQRNGPGSGGALDGASPVTWYVFCMTNPSPGQCPAGADLAAQCGSLWRYNGNGCAPPAISCGENSNNRSPVAVGNAYYAPLSGQFANFVFRRDNSIGGVEMRYSVGVSTASTSRPNAIAFTVHQRVAMSKAYSNASD